MLQYNASVSGSLNVTGSIIVSNGITGTINGVDVQIFSASVSETLIGIQTATGSQEGRLGSIESFTSSTSARLNSIETTSASVDTLNTAQNSRLSALETTSASVDILNTNQNTRLTGLEIKTGSLATTGSNTFIGTQTITGSLFISSNLIVQGSSSLQNITASAVSIGTNLINLNTANPAIRLAGLVIGDSGSVGGSGSFLYDSVQDEFIFVHRGANTTVTSSVVLMGPQTFDSIGNETYLTTNRIPKGAGNEHLIDSNISDNGTTIVLNSNTEVTGSLLVSSNTSSSIATFMNTNTAGSGNGVLIQVGSESGTNNYALSVTTNAISRLYVREDGNVGIGTTNTGYKLQVNGDTAFFSTSGNLNSIITQGAEGKGRFYLYDGGTATIALQTNGTTYFNAGNVAIGDTATSGYKLFVNGNTYIKGSENTSASYALVAQNSSASNLFLVRNDGRTTISGVNNDVNGQLEIIATGGAGADAQLSFGTALNGRGMYVDDSDTNKLKIFGGAGKGVAGTEFTIDNIGKVGICTTNPSLGNLQITGDNNQLAIHTVGTWSSLYFFNGGQDRGALYVSNSETHLEGRGSSGLFFGGASSQNHMMISTGGNTGIGLTDPLGKLSTLGGAVQIMGDYRNHATIIKSAGAVGTYTGQLTITIPQMSNASTDGFGGYACEVYVSGFSGWFCHVWFSGYVNGGITVGETTILRSSGGWSISQSSFGANNQGFQFVIDYPGPFIVHPTARIIFSKGGSVNATAYPANEITAVFS